MKDEVTNPSGPNPPRKPKRASRRSGGKLWDNIVPSREIQHKLKRDALLRIAIPAFNRKGFHQTSLDEIAEQVGVTKAALYYYFPNKNALLAACFEHAHSISDRSLEMARDMGKTGREKLILCLRLYLENAIDDLGESMLLTEDHCLDPRARADLVETRDKLERAMRSLVSEGIRDGSIAPCDPKMAVFALLGAVNWVPKWYSPDGTWSPQQLAGALTEMLDRMLSSEPAARMVEDVGTWKSGNDEVAP